MDYLEKSKLRYYLSFFLKKINNLSQLGLFNINEMRHDLFGKNNTDKKINEKKYLNIYYKETEKNGKVGWMNIIKIFRRFLYRFLPLQEDLFCNNFFPKNQSLRKMKQDEILTLLLAEGHGTYFLSKVQSKFSASTLSGMGKSDASKYSMSVSMYRGGRGTGRPKTAPPDLPSLLLDARICYLGMPIVPAVTELIVAQFMWLDYDNPSKPIYLYINSSGTLNEKNETVGSETEAYSIADMMSYVKADVYTVNCGMAFGQAAMLLSLGTKGYRAVQPNSSTKLYLPKVNRSSGAVIDMWIKAKELEANTEYYIELLAKGTGKSKEEIAKDVQRPKYLQAQDAIDYGIADKIIDSSSRDVAFEKRVITQHKATYSAPNPMPSKDARGWATSM
ncbi:hypothetical protein JHK87_029145 [Glycine soja]|nr:hypothetical protein JHK87_029145 [Glycine soja]